MKLDAKPQHEKSQETRPKEIKKPIGKTPVDSKVDQKNPVDEADSDEEFSKLPLWKRNLMKKKAAEETQKWKEKQAMVSVVLCCGVCDTDLHE